MSSFTTSGFFFPMRLAWRQLKHDKIRFMTAVSGVIFACVLVFMQIGFKAALFESATLLQRTMLGDLYLESKQSEALWRVVPFPKRYMYQALSVDGVDDVTALYAGQAPWKNPKTGVNRTALILGIDPQSQVYPLHGLEENKSLLKMRNSVLFDEWSRPEFGPVASVLGEKGEFPVEVSGKLLDVVGTFRMGITFSADGNLIVNDTTFFELFPMKSQEGVDIGIITLKKGADILQVQSRLKEILPDHLKIMTREEYIADEKAYWNDITPIGYIFNFGVIMGLFVGLVIVYQVLFNDITNHLHEYATLKAMGYDNGYFNRVVVSASMILIIGGFIPSWISCQALYKIVEKSIFIEMNLTFEKVITTFILISCMCFLSAFLAVRKLKSASPVDVFQ
ncbi:MAG: ABC transporter permease DevC [Pseudobdellovibrionaceae bacterium]|jgi:putative ABC transport system permease protein|nr:ABC transporter permease DevC [Pseudobdellovibrionaceae bacterium]